MIKEFIIKSLLAGWFIAVAQLLSLTVASTTGLFVIPAIMFSIGLLSVFKFKGNLYTGKVGYISNWKNIKLIPMLVLNLVACVPFFFLSVNGMAAPAWFGFGVVELLIKGILCGMFIYFATYFWNKEQYKVPFVILCVAGFILCGGRHCIADFAALCIYSNSLPQVLAFLPKIGITALGNGIGSVLFKRIIK